MRAIRYIVVFAAIFALGGVLAVIIGVFSQEIDSSQRILTIILAVMFALYGAGAAGMVGAVTGLLYVVLPPRAQDTWVASALGAGVVACGAILFRAISYQPVSTPWFVTLLLMAALAASLSAWCVRPRLK